jgi:hypothetical protein
MHLAFSSRETPVEYHVRKYKDAARRAGGSNRFMDRMHYGWRLILNEPAGRWEDNREVDNHERALLGLGYLEEREFIVPGVAVSNIGFAVHRTMLKRGTNWEFFHGRMSGTNGVRIVTVKGKMPTMEEVLGEITSGIGNQP